jgi:hypothetical protein
VWLKEGEISRCISYTVETSNARLNSTINQDLHFNKVK